MHPAPDKEPIELQTALGRLVMCWAPLEAMLDGVCATIFHGFQGDTVQPELPRSFKRKIIFVRQCSSKLPRLRPLAASIGPVLDAASLLAEDRHWLIHGFNLPENPMLEETWATFGGVVREARAYKLGAKRYTVPEIYALSNRCLQMVLDEHMVRTM